MEKPTLIIAKNITNIEPYDVIMCFARLGFRKTSMEEIAKSVGLSRQSIYKKFGSKEACYDWTLRTYMERTYSRVFALLDDIETAPFETLEKVFNLIAGDTIEIGKFPHGAQILEDTLKLAASGPIDLPEAYGVKLAEFLCRHELASTSQRGQDLSRLLIAASRGSLIVAESREDFTEDMRRHTKTALAKA